MFNLAAKFLSTWGGRELCKDSMASGSSHLEMYSSISHKTLMPFFLLFEDISGDIEQLLEVETCDEVN